MGRKTKNLDREWSDLQKARAEIKTLKKQLSRERKLRKKIEDGQAIAHLIELVDIQRREDKKLHEDKIDIDVRGKWQCFNCDEGIMKLMIFNRIDGVFYYRRCECGNKTRMKKYHDGVEGVEEGD